MQDSQLKTYLDYLTKGVLPDDSKTARTIILESPDYVVDGGVLYHLYYPRGKGHKWIELSNS